MTTTTHDFGNGPVRAHRHVNGGGWVADSATVAESAYVGPNAKVYGDAFVLDNARIEDSARVYGGAFIMDSAQVAGHARVCWYGRLEGNMRADGTTAVIDDDHLYRPSAQWRI